MGVIGRIKSRLSKASQKNLRLINYNRNRSYWVSNSIYLDNIYNKIATDVAMMEFKHIKKTEKTWTDYNDSDLIGVLKTEPNEDDTSIYFWSDVVRSILENGCALVIPIYKNGKLKSLELADQVSAKENGRFTVVVDGVEMDVDKHNVWIFKNPKKNLTVQLNRVASLIDTNLQALSKKLNEEENSHLRGLVKIPFKVADDMMKGKANKVLEQVREVASTGGIGYLDHDMEFQELKNGINTADSTELEFLKSQLYQAHGMNEKLFTCDYSEAQYRAYFMSVLKVYQRVLYEEINRKHFTQTARTQGHELKIFHDILNISSLKDYTEFSSKGVFNAIISANEAREAVGYPPYEGGDIFRTNLNSQEVNGKDEGGEDNEKKMMRIKAVGDDEGGVFEGYLSTYGNADRTGDVIEAGSFDKSIKKKSVVPLLFNHERNKVIGKLSLTSDADGLLVKGTLNLDDPEAKNINSLLKMGALDGLSIGMGVKEYEAVDSKNPFGAWRIKEADVYEGSVVTVPANEQALISTVKDLTEKERIELEALRKEKQLTKVEAQLKYVEAKLNET